MSNDYSTLDSFDVGSTTSDYSALDKYNLGDESGEQEESILQIAGKVAKGVGLGVVDIPRRATEKVAIGFFSALGKAGYIDPNKVEDFKAALAGQREERFKDSYGGEFVSGAGTWAAEQALLALGIGRVAKTVGAAIPATAKAAQTLAPGIFGRAYTQAAAGAGTAMLNDVNPLAGAILGGATELVPGIFTRMPATPGAEKAAAMGIPQTVGQAVGSQALQKIEGYGALAKQNKTLADKFKSQGGAGPGIEERIFQGNQKAYDDITAKSQQIEARSRQNYDELAYQLDQLGPAQLNETLRAAENVKRIMTDPKTVNKPNPAINDFISVFEKNPVVNASDINRFKDQIESRLRQLKQPGSGALDSDFSLLNDLRAGLDKDLRAAADKVGLTKEIDEADQYFSNTVVKNREFIKDLASERKDVGKFIDRLYTSKPTSQSGNYDDLKQYLSNMSEEGKEHIATGLLTRAAHDFIDPRTKAINVDRAIRFMEAKSSVFGLTAPKNSRDMLEGLNNFMKALETDAIKIGQGKVPLPGINIAGMDARQIAQLAGRMLINEKTLPAMVRFKNYKSDDPRMAAVVRSMLIDIIQMGLRGAAVESGSELATDIFNPRDQGDR